MTDLADIAAKIALSAVLGGAIGAERERTGKWAGLRTHMLIAVGSALLADVSISVGEVYGPDVGWDPGRIAAQIVSGLGFIGAGTIIQSRGTVHGLTTAAGLWVAGAIGLAVGAGFFDEAAVATAALLLILAALKPLARRLAGGRLQSVILRLDSRSRLSDLLAIVEEEGIELESVDVGETGRGVQERSVRLLFVGPAAERNRLVTRLAREEWVEPEGG